VSGRMEVAKSQSGWIIGGQIGGNRCVFRILGDKNKASVRVRFVGGTFSQICELAT
jgi:hypothetical protein